MALTRENLTAPQGELSPELVLGSAKGTEERFNALLDGWLVRATVAYPDNEGKQMAWVYFLAYTYIADRLASVYASESANNTYARSVSSAQIEYWRQRAAGAKADAGAATGSSSGLRTIGVRNNFTF